MLALIPLHTTDRERHEQPSHEVVAEILQTLDELGVRIEARPGVRLYYTPRKVVGGYLRELMRQYKGKLVERQGKGAA